MNRADAQTRQPRPDAASGARLATHTARLLADGKCEDVVVFDVRGVSSIADFLVIATGTSDRQARSAADELDLLADHLGERHPRVSGGAGHWLVADFSDVVVHIFSPEARGYYDLESLWADGKKVDWHAATKPGQFANLRAKRDAGGESDA